LSDLDATQKRLSQLEAARQRDTLRQYERRELVKQQVEATEELDKILRSVPPHATVDSFDTIRDSLPL
jgi:predicted ABC-class ATPase